MPLPAGFPAFREPKSKRIPPLDYTSRGVKFRLFAWLAAIMLVLTVIERGRDPRMWEWFQNGPAAGPFEPAAAKPAAPQPIAAERRAPEATGTSTTPDLAEILDRYDLGPSEFEALADERPLTANEDELLTRILYRFPQLGLDSLYHWRQQGVSWDQLASEPAEYRAKIFHVRGRATSVEKIALPAERAERFEFAHYYRVKLTLDDSPQTAIIFARHVPAAWLLDQPLNEPALTDALFLKLGEAESAAPQLLFAADRIGWLPDKLDAARGIGPAQTALAKLGMDISLWDDVRELNDRPLGSGDREAFYQLLAALGKSEASQLLPAASGPLDLGSLLQQPRKQQGSVVSIAGVARRITRIDVPDDVRSRLGVDHYYEIDLFVPVGKTSIRLGEGQGEGSQPVFRNTFPATLVVRQLPPGLEPKENLHEQISANGVFFKVWTYDSRYTASFGQIQLAPLFVAQQPRLVAAPAGDNWFSSLLVSTALGLALAILMLALWWSFRPARRRVTSHTPPPDFSHLR